MLKSVLFAGDQLLQDIADDVGNVRISQSENATDPAVGKVQRALLIRDPGCLPVSGADGVFGGESAAAVHRFKIDELGVPEAQVVNDVGPATVIRLDEIAAAAETSSISLFNQFGEPLPNVAFTVDDGGPLRAGVTDALGSSAVALTSPGTITIDPASLADVVGNLLDRPVIAADASDPGDGAIITPQTILTVNLSQGSHLKVVIVARIDLRIDLRTELEGEMRNVGSGVKIFLEGQLVRAALQINDGSTADVFLDPPPSSGTVTAMPPLTGWVPPNGYVVRPGDTADSLGQRFLGDPGLFEQLSDHDPVPGEILQLPDRAVPSWIRIATDPLPPPPAPKVWFSVTPNSVIQGLYIKDGPVDPLHQLLEAIGSPPAADLDPSTVSATNADVLTAFLSLPPETISADIVETSTEGDFDELVS